MYKKPSKSEKSNYGLVDGPVVLRHQRPSCQLIITAANPTMCSALACEVCEARYTAVQSVHR